MTRPVATETGKKGAEPSASAARAKPVRRSRTKTGSGGTGSAGSSAAPPRRPRKSLPPPQSSASPMARRQAAAILEVLAGLRKPSEAAAVLETSLVRYYQLERRALDGLVAACEPRPKGPPIDPERRLRELERALVRREQECRRQEALARVAQRALGLAPAARTAPATARGKYGEQDDKLVSGSGKRRRRRRPVVRALKAAQELRQGPVGPEGVVNSPVPSGVVPALTSPAGPTSLAPPAGSPA